MEFFFPFILGNLLKDVFILIFKECILEFIQVYLLFKTQLVKVNFIEIQIQNRICLEEY